jgi:hypothetical protein
VGATWKEASGVRRTVLGEEVRSERQTVARTDSHTRGCTEKREIEKGSGARATTKTRREANGIRRIRDIEKGRREKEREE